jgi:thymidylate synthase
MNITNISSTTISEAWYKCLKEILTNGYEYNITSGSSGTEGQTRKELDFVTIQITNPGVRPLVPDVPIGMTPPTSDEYIQSYTEDYLLSSTKRDGETYTYGQYIAPQFDAVVAMYQTQGHNTNQATIMVGNENSIYSADPPCLRLIDTRIRYGKLHWVCYFRSWDMAMAMPTNLGGLQLAKEMMADLIGVDDGELIACSKGAHVYGDDLEYARLVTRM